MWYQNGKVHRDDGPAVIFPDGAKKWYRKGLLHRLDGPAILESAGHSNSWWVEGNMMSSMSMFKKYSGASDEMMVELILKYGEIKS